MAHYSCFVMPFLVISLAIPCTAASGALEFGASPSLESHWCWEERISKDPDLREIFGCLDQMDDENEVTGCAPAHAIASVEQHLILTLSPGFRYFLDSLPPGVNTVKPDEPALRWGCLNCHTTFSGMITAGGHRPCACVGAKSIFICNICPHFNHTNLIEDDPVKAAKEITRHLTEYHYAGEFGYVPNCDLTSARSTAAAHFWSNYIQPELSSQEKGEIRKQALALTEIKVAKSTRIVWTSCTNAAVDAILPDSPEAQVADSFLR